MDILQSMTQPTLRTLLQDMIPLGEPLDPDANSEPTDYIFPRLHSSLTSSLPITNLEEQIQTLRTTYLEPVNDLLTSATPNIFSIVIFLVILFISLRVLGYVFRMITFWVMLVLRLAFWAVFLGSAWYIYTVGWERAGRDLGWVWGVVEGFTEDFQTGSRSKAGRGDGTGWYPGGEYGGRTGAYGGDAWGRHRGF